MLNKLSAALRDFGLERGGETVICAVSGGADSMALLWGMWLLREKFHLRVEAAHFNHHLRGDESRRDEEFVREFCRFHDIPLHLGGAEVKPGAKGLEAAAREARYAYLMGLDGLVATAHTADDNAETVLMHLIRGTGLRGLGGIAPRRGRLIRPMLDITRQEVEAFLRDNWIAHVEDSSNAGDAFLRNRIRQRIMPLLRQENPAIGSSLSAMARRLRQEEQVLDGIARQVDASGVTALRQQPEAVQRRALEGLLKRAGLAEPTACHIEQAMALVRSDHPSAYARFPGGVILRRCYDRLEPGEAQIRLEPAALPENGSLRLEQIGLKIRCRAGDCRQTGAPHAFVVCPSGEMVVRCRLPGDTMRLPGGTRSLKKCFVDRRIPAARRMAVPVIADAEGVLGVYGIGANLDRTAGGKPVTICFEPIAPDGDNKEFFEEKRL